MSDQSVFVIEYFTASGPPTVVWSEDLNMIQTFIKQHNFDTSNLKRYVIPGCDIDKHCDIIDSDTQLIVKQLKSNVDHTIHDIVTTDDIIDSIIQSVCDDLVDHLMFGDAICRSDLVFIDDIVNTIEKVEYSSICDFSLISDDIVDRYYDEDYTLGISQYPRFPPPTDTSYIYDSLNAARFDSGPLPFTLEAYVHYFISQIMEEE